MVQVDESMPRVLRLQSQSALKSNLQDSFDLGCVRCVALLDRMQRSWLNPGWILGYVIGITVSKLPQA